MRYGVVPVNEAHFADANGRITKRLVDVTISCLGLALFSPLLLLAAIAIKLETLGPVLTSQRCCGLGGEPFDLFRFSTTRPHLSDMDQAMTHIGILLRRSGIEDIPQLINVLRGDMSIVGPRPRAFWHAGMLEKRVKPGLTGWAQVNGYATAPQTSDERKRTYELDDWYIDHQSLSLDLAIIRRTLKRAFELQKFDEPLV